MTLKEAIKRIEELERKIKELEACPQHLHFYSPPVYIPVQPVYPMYPSWPYQPSYPPYLPVGPTWIAGAAGGGAGNLLIYNS